MVLVEAKERKAEIGEIEEERGRGEVEMRRRLGDIKGDKRRGGGVEGRGRGREEDRDGGIYKGRKVEREGGVESEDDTH